MNIERKHDISAFCEYESCAYDLDTVKYDPANKCLMATDGKVCMFVPFDGGDEGFHLSGATLGDLFSGRATLSLSPDGNASTSLKRDATRWPDVVELVAKCNPHTHTVIVKTQMLETIAKYAKRAGAQSVYFGFAGETDPVRAVFAGLSDEVQAYALFMPAERVSEGPAVDMVAKAFS